MISDFFKSNNAGAAGGSTSGKKITSMDEESSSKKPERTVEEKAADPFMTFDEFVDQLGSWKTLLAKYTASPKFRALYNNVKEAYSNPKVKCYPPKEQIFNCFRHTNLNDIKVVVVGQDPYHQPGQAMGLCFSVNKGIKVPPSLVNIYKAIEQDPAFKTFKSPSHGDLTRWADQGVLLLNTVLTVEDSKPNSHDKFGWLDFTNEVIRLIANELENIIFLLWGKPAEKKAEIINKSNKKHHILNAVHPSPLSASRGWFDCRHFSKVNEILTSMGKPTIDWSLN